MSFNGEKSKIAYTRPIFQIANTEGIIIKIKIKLFPLTLIMVMEIYEYYSNINLRGINITRIILSITR